MAAEHGRHRPLFHRRRLREHGGDEPVPQLGGRFCSPDDVAGRRHLFPSGQAGSSRAAGHRRPARTSKPHWQILRNAYLWPESMLHLGLHRQCLPQSSPASARRIARRTRATTPMPTRPSGGIVYNPINTTDAVQLQTDQINSVNAEAATECDSNAVITVNEWFRAVAGREVPTITANDSLYMRPRFWLLLVGPATRPTRRDQHKGQAPPLAHPLFSPPASNRSSRPG